MLFKNLVANKESVTDDFVAILKKPSGLANSSHDLGVWLRAIFSPDPTARSLDRESYRSLKLPVALIWGELDEVTPLAEGRDIQSLIVGASLKAIPRAGHVPQVEFPAAFETLLIASLAAQRAAAQ